MRHDIIAAHECPSNEGTAVFRVGDNTYRHPWTVGRIELRSRVIGSTDANRDGNWLGDTLHSEDMVVVFDEDGVERVSWPRRYAMLEYAAPSKKDGE